MSLKSLAAALLVVPTLSTAALADNHTWDGVYFGILAGFEGGQSTSNAVGSTTQLTIDFSGAKIGGLVGFNASNGNFVFGAEADVSATNLTGSKVCSGLPQTCTVSANWDATVRARAGVVHNDILFYGTAGALFSQAKSQTSPASAGTTGTNTASLTGWVAGVGAEVATANNFRFRVEYLRSESNKLTAPAGTVGTPAFEGDRKSNQVRFALVRPF